MLKRKVVALALLLSVAWALSTPAAAQSRATMSPKHQAAWGYFLGLEDVEALTFGLLGAVECWFVPGIGSLACAIAGVF